MRHDRCDAGHPPDGGTPSTYPYALELEQVSLSFDKEPVLRNLDLKVAQGETRVILGRSGAGKSTILKLALGLLRPDSGRVKVFGVDITGRRERELAEMRHRIGMVFQGGALFDSMSVAENVGFCLLEKHQIPMEQAAPVIRERLHYVGLEDAFDLMPSQLSGGMAKRVAVARATVCHPELMLYDEPTGGLDPISTRRMNRLINRLRDDLHVTSVVVTHILRDARTVADAITMIHEGRTIFEGTPADILASTDPFVRDFISERGI